MKLAWNHCAKDEKSQTDNIVQNDTNTVSQYLCDTIAICDWLIDWKEFYAVSAIFQPCNGGLIFENMHNTRNEEKYLEQKM